MPIVISARNVVIPAGVTDSDGSASTLGALNASLKVHVRAFSGDTAHGEAGRDSRRRGVLRSG